MHSVTGYLLCAIILGLIAEDFPPPGLQGLSVSEAIAVTLMVIVAIKAVRSRFRLSVTSPITRPCLLFILLTLLLLVAELIHLVLAANDLNAGITPLEHVARRILGLLLITSALFLPLSQSQARALGVCVGILASAQALSILLGVATGLNFHPERFAAARIGIFDVGSASLGIISTKGMVAIIFCLATTFGLKFGERSASRFIASLGFLGFLALGAIFSGSRSVFFSMVMTAATWVGMRNFRFNVATVAGVGLALLMLTIFLFAPTIAFFNEIILRGGSEGRLIMGLQAIDLYLDNVLFGIGPHQRIFEMYAGGEVLENGSHNLILQALLYGGVVGALWLFSLLFLFVRAVQLCPDKNIALAVAFLLPSMFFQPLQSAFVSWSTMLALVLYFVRYWHFTTFQRNAQLDNLRTERDS